MARGIFGPSPPGPNNQLAASSKAAYASGGQNFKPFITVIASQPRSHRPKNVMMTECMGYNTAL
jgi:hypothetical protein